MKKNIFKTALFFLAFLTVAGCSSAPKRPMLVTDSYNTAYTRLEMANNELIAGNLLKAYDYLSESYRLALSIDNSSLLTKISLSGVMLKISEEKSGEKLVSSIVTDSFLAQPKATVYEEAVHFARRSENSSDLLKLCSIYEVQVQLSEKKGEKNSMLSTLSEAEKAVLKEPYYLAFLNRTRGDVFMNAGEYSAAEKSYQTAAEIHTKERYLSEIGLDWYCIARSRSLSGNKNGAVNAIETALKYDRDAENTAAIVLDYEAYSKILLKGNPSEKDVKLSRELSDWAQKISRTQAE